MHYVWCIDVHEVLRGWRIFICVLCASFQIVHKQLTCESVLIFENFVLKLTNFDVRDSSSTDQPEKHSTTTRAVSVYV